MTSLQESLFNVPMNSTLETMARRYTQPNKSMIRDITIRTVLNGYIVKVGCQTVVFANQSQMMTQLSRYLAFPDEVEAEFRNTSINSTHCFANPVPCEPPRNACPDLDTPSRIPR